MELQHQVLVVQVVVLQVVMLLQLPQLQELQILVVVQDVLVMVKQEMVAQVL